MNADLERELALDEAIDLAKAARNEPAANSPKRLLVFEDDLYCAKLLRSHLTRAWPDCEIILASNKKELVAALEQNRYDLILSDYLVPDFSGLAALSLVRKQLPEIPFIFVSGSIGDDVGVECLKLGATDYVLKNRLPQLVPAIQRALDEAEKKYER
jgi:CheY-like chemotaxis protein